MITLNVNKWLGALTNLVAYSQVADTHERGKVGGFVESFQDINVENGDGKVVLSSDLLSVNDLSRNSSLLTNNDPTINEQYVSVENYKVIPMSINRYLGRNAFVDEYQLANFLGYLKSIMQATKVVYLSKELIKELEAYTPTLPTQKITIQQIDTTGLTDPMQLDAAERWNAKKIQKELIKVLNAMGFSSDKYNDLGEEDVFDFGSLKMLIRTSTDTEILVDSLASLLNSDKITDAQKWGETFSIPDEQFNDQNNKFVAWLMHKKKIQFGYFYEVATSFFDGSTLDERDWLHFAYYLDTIDALPCVCFELDASLTPAALS